MKYLITALTLLASAASAQQLNSLVITDGAPQNPNFAVQAEGSVVSFTVPTGATQAAFSGTGVYWACADSPAAPRCGTSRPTGTVTNGNAWDPLPTRYLLGYVSNTSVSRIWVDPVSSSAVVKFYR